MKIQIKSQFVQANIDVKTGDILTILNEGEYRPVPNTDRENLIFQVQLPDGRRKLVGVNNTSQRELVAAWGDETKNWVGKRVKVELVRQMVFNKFKDVIYLHPYEPEGISASEPENISNEEIPIIEDEQ